MSELLRQGNWTIDWGKIILLAGILISATVLAALGVLDEGTVETILLIQVGYLVGNGVNAARGQRTSSAISKDRNAN